MFKGDEDVKVKGSRMKLVKNIYKQMQICFVANVCDFERKHFSFNGLLNGIEKQY